MFSFVTMEPSTPTHQKYYELILAAQSTGVLKLLIREWNNILYIDGQAPSGKVKEELWKIYQKIDPEFKSGDLVLNLQTVR